MAKKSKKDINKEEVDNTAVDTQEQNKATAEEQPTDAEQEEQTAEEKLEEQLKHEKDKFLRLFAEFENYKRRTAKERVELYKTAGEGVLKDLLPVLDDFDRGMVEIRKSEDEQLVTGVELISNKLRTILKSKGLEVVDVEAGSAFDAEVHDAVTQIPAPSEEMKGKIIDVIETGYKLGDRIIRHPKVVVGQ
jgi:molecular chaperone GrpE